MSRPMRPQSSSSTKSRLASNRLKSSSNALLVRSPNNQNTSSVESTMATLDNFLAENHQNSQTLLTNQDLALVRSSEEFHMSFQNMLSEQQNNPHLVFKSTLANLSQGLAALNEGDYLQWDCYNSQKVPRTSNQPIIKSEIEHRQRPYSVQTSIGTGGYGNSYSRDSFSDINKTDKVKIVDEEIDEIKELNETGPCYPVYHQRVSLANSQDYRTEPVVIKNDIRWKDYGSLQRELEILKTEESLEALRNRNREQTEIQPSRFEKYEKKRSSSVKHKRPLLKEFQEWKTILIERKEALAVKKEAIKKEKPATPAIHIETKKEEAILPKLNIGGNILSAVRQNKEFIKLKETTLRANKRKKILGLKGIPADRSALSGTKTSTNYENLIQQRNSSPDIKEEPNNRENENRILLRSKGSASIVTWDEESLFQKIENKSQDEKQGTKGASEKVQSDQYNTKGLVPTLKIKRDSVMRKQIASQQKTRSRGESRDMSKDKSREHKTVETEKVAKPQSETQNASPKKTTDAFKDMLTAQMILEQRLKTLEDKYVQKEEESGKYRRMQSDIVGESEEKKKVKNFKSRKTSLVVTSKRIGITLKELL